MKKDALITLKATSTADGESETTELVTEGYFYQKDGKYFLSYTETEATGFDGDTTTLKVDGQKAVTMLRFGKSRTHLLIESGRRNPCSYDTGYGIMDIEIVGGRIRNRLTEMGGRLTFAYTIDVDRDYEIENSIDISVRIS